MVLKFVWPVRELTWIYCGRERKGGMGDIGQFIKVYFRVYIFRNLLNIRTRIVTFAIHVMTQQNIWRTVLRHLTFMVKTYSLAPGRINMSKPTKI